MSGRSVLADTNIIIYLVGGDETAADLLTDCNVFLSFVTQLELLSFKKLTPQEESVIEQVFQNSTIIHSDNSLVLSAAKLRRKYSIELPDALIIATALKLKVPLVTADKKLVKIDLIEVIEYRV